MCIYIYIYILIMIPNTSTTYYHIVCIHIEYVWICGFKYIFVDGSQQPNQHWGSELTTMGILGANRLVVCFNTSQIGRIQLNCHKLTIWIYQITWKPTTSAESQDPRIFQTRDFHLNLRRSSCQVFSHSSVDTQILQPRWLPLMRTANLPGSI